MTKTRARTVVGVFVASISIFLASVASLPLLVASVLPSGVMDIHVVGIWAIYFLGGLVVGVALPKRWFVAVLVAWYPLVYGLSAPITNCMNEYDVPYYCAQTVNVMWVSPLIALVAGFLGRMLFDRWAMKTGEGSSVGSTRAGKSSRRRMGQS